MDPCIPSTNINNARSVLRSQLGVPKLYAKNFSRKRICEAFKRCKNAKTLPPMEIDIYDGYIYMIDSESPLKAKHYHIIFEKGTKKEVILVAKKLGLIDLEKTKKELIANIINLLENLNIKEPIKSMKVPKIKNNGINISSAGTLPEMNNGNRNNGNRNFGGLPEMNNGNRNLGGLPGMNNGNRNLGGRLPGMNNGRPNVGMGVPTQNRGFMPNAATFNRQNEGTQGFKPGRPVPKGKMPSAVNSGGAIVSGTKSLNKSNLVKRLNKIKDELGVFSIAPAPTKNATATKSTGTVQHFYLGGPPSTPSSFAGSVAPSSFAGSMAPSSFPGSVAPPPMSST